MRHRQCTLAQQSKYESELMFALCDVTAAYASAEKIYDPTIRDKPVLVLSNNDSNVVALCPIAKQLGFKKFVPYFQIADAAKNAGVIVKSSNYELYQDTANRLFSTLERFCDNVHEYSIDEAFLSFESSLKNRDWYLLGHEIRKTVWREVKIPIGVGFGPTPTLAKAANHASKKLPGCTGSAIINTYAERKRILTQMSVNDVWGIGSRIAKRLKALNINDAFSLAQQDPKKMRKLFSILVENTVRELNGEKRLTWDDVRPNKKEIYSSRSFSERITTPVELKKALAFHAEIAANKLRKQHSVAGSITLFAANSPHDNTHYVKRTSYATFIIPTCDTRDFLNVISDAIPRLFLPGVKYYKAGLGLLDIRDNNFQQADLFAAQSNDSKLMEALDSVNQRFGRDTLSFAAKGFHRTFDMKRNFLSKRYTTRWTDIPKIKC